MIVSNFSKKYQFSKRYGKGDGENFVAVTTQDSDGLLHVCWEYKGTMFFEKMKEKDFFDAIKGWGMC